MFPKILYAPEGADGGGDPGDGGSPQDAPVQKTQTATMEQMEGSEFWRALPDEFRQDPAFQKFKEKDLPDVLNSYKHLETYRGRSYRIPEEGDQEAWEELNKRFAPEDIKAYEYERPEDLPEDLGFDEERLNRARERFQKIGIRPDQFKEIMSLNDEINREALSELRHEQEVRRSEAEAELRKQPEWTGKNFDRNLNLAMAARDRYLSDDPESPIRKFLDESGLGNHPHFVQAMYNIGKELMESPPPGVSTMGMGQGGAAAELERIKTDPSHKYYEAYLNPQHKEHEAAKTYMSNLYKEAYPERGEED